MTGPLMILALLSLGGGFINIPHWLSQAYPLTESENYTPMIISAGFGILGILIAFFIYVLRPGLSESFRTSLGPVYTLVNNKYYVDEVYNDVVVEPVKGLSRFVLWKGIDNAVIDSAFVNGFGILLRQWGSLLRQLQSGSIRNYATWVLAGSLLVIFVLGVVGGSK